MISREVRMSRMKLLRLMEFDATKEVFQLMEEEKEVR